ncbi:MAG: nucleotidyl transferase AbiEii/AbiGii toxin family protein [Candidatus Aegiribacteria sp.]|nr:nucleotidyl transferase AbiEii/AbiGii toxin family protein [Candidatus Aegiribacteria sp.]
MISRAEIGNLSVEWGLREEIVEKDYVIGWLLWGIGSHQVLRDTWIFKGGTCLKKCYFETYRFSEDLDFTILHSGSIEPDTVKPMIEEVIERVQEESGIDFSAMEVRFDLRPTGSSSEGRIYYIGPRKARSPAKVKIDLNAVEKVARPPILRKINHPYSDSHPGNGVVRCYSFEELFAEKIRALGERSRPRDLYDVVSIHRNSGLRKAPQLVSKVLAQKCASKGVPIPTHRSICTSEAFPELESEWENMLGHQLHSLPPYDAYLEAMEEFFLWLEGLSPPKHLTKLPMGPSEDLAWSPPPTLYAWGTRTPLEPIRFAGSNRLVVRIHYQKENGQRVRRTIEPYAFRRTQDDNIILRAFDLTKQDYRSFRVDRLLTASVTKIPFKPRNIVEFSQMGSIAIPSDNSTYSRSEVVRSHRIKSSSRQKQYGPVYIIECNTCGRRFPHKKRTTSLRKHKDKNGQDCYGRRGHVAETRY